MGAHGEHTSIDQEGGQKLKFAAILSIMMLFGSPTYGQLSDRPPTQAELQYAAQLTTYQAGLEVEVGLRKSLKGGDKLKRGTGCITPGRFSLREGAFSQRCEAFCAIPCDPHRSPAGCLGSSCGWLVDDRVTFSGEYPENPKIEEIVAALGPRAGGCAWPGYTNELFHANRIALMTACLRGACGSGYDCNPTNQEMHTLPAVEDKDGAFYRAFLPPPPADRDQDGVPDTGDRPDLCPDVVGMFWPPSSSNLNGCPATAPGSVPLNCEPAYEIRAYIDMRCSRPGLGLRAKALCALRVGLPDEFVREEVCAAREWWREKEGKK